MQQPSRIKELFEQALDIESAAERSAFLEQACAGRRELLDRVQALLRAHETAHEFLPDLPATGSEVPITEKPGDRIGRYKLLQKIGEGGCGVVYMAEQEEPVRRRVALKIIKLGMDTRSVVARFEAERQALAMMDHPNIARVFDAGATETGRPYFVMELVRGVRITEYCDEQQLNTRERLALFTNVCRAIQHAHQKGIIHRDIKPSNVLVTVNDGAAVPKVIDFGTAKAMEHRLTDKTLFTEFHAFIGTPVYMSPEQAEMSSLDIDTRSDIYSLGVLLYELLTGRTPFDAQELMRAGLDEVRRTIRECEPARPSTRLSKLPQDDLTRTAERRRIEGLRLIHSIRGDLDWIVMKCLEKDRTRRYETANGIAKDIERHLINEPVSACPPSTWYRMRKSIRRNRLFFASASTVMIALTVVASLSTWMFMREREVQQEQSRLLTVAETQSAVAREAVRELRLRSYAADMKVAHIALLENNVGRTVELLERWFPVAGEADLRGIEWRYLWQASRNAARHVFTQESVMNAATLSPDSRFLAAGGIDGQARIWEIATRKVVAHFEGTPNMHGLAWAPHGRWLAVSETNRMVIRERADWKIVHESPGAANCLAWSPDGQTLAGGRGASLCLWNTADWTITTVGTNLTGITRLTFSADSRRLCVSRSGRVEVWDLPKLTRTHEFRELRRPLSVAISPDDQWLAAGDSGGALLLWHLQSQRLVAQTNAHSSWLFGLAFSIDGRRLISGGGDQIIRFWEMPSTIPPAPVRLTNSGILKGHKNEIWGLEISRDGRWLVSAGKDGTARVWDSIPRHEDNHWLKFGNAGAQLLEFTPDSRGVRMLRRDGSAIEEWDLDDGHLIRSLRVPVASAWKADGVQLALVLQEDCAWIARTNGALEFWDLAANQLQQTLHVTNRTVLPLRLSPDGKHLAIRDPNSGEGALWNTATGQRETKLAPFPETGWWEFSRAVFSPDNRFFAHATPGYQISLWDVAAQRETHRLRGHGWHIYALSFSPDGRWLASSSWDGRIRLWITATGEEAMPPLSGHLGGVRVIDFTPDGRTLLAADDAGSLRAWHLATGQEMLNLLSHSPLTQGIVSPNGRILLLDPPTPAGHLRVWRLPGLEEIQND
ncbi:MAG: protein kinase [Verrucomicrobiota bacterium]